MILKRFSFLFILLLYCSKNGATQESLLPMGSRFTQEHYLTADGESIAGNGLFPISEKEFGLVYAKEYDSTPMKKSWLNRKLFHQHFFEIRGEDYFLSIDPLLNLSLGSSLSPTEIDLFQNTRAFQVQGEVMGKVAFYSSFFENQARFADFQTDYFEDRGEQRYAESKGYYDTINAVIPGGGRTKPFKDGGFDYASAISYIRYRPNDFLAVQFGNHPQFIGWGHRSLLLSDNSFNFSNLKFDWSLSERWSFSTIHGKQLNLVRRIRSLGDTTFVTTVEEPYEKKNYSAKYLTFSPNDNLVLGFFESQVYFREDSIHSQWMHPMYFNPLPLINTVVYGWENNQAKSLLGFNFAWKFWKNKTLYGQFVTDEITNNNFQWGAQIGIKSNHLFGVKDLFLLGEFNTSTDQLYAANNRRLAYTHYNLPLAHTLGNGFSEVIAKLHYEYKRIYLDFHGVKYRAERPIYNMQSLFNSKGNYNNQITDVLFIESEIGYCFNPLTKLSAFVKGIYRKENVEDVINQTTLLFIGVKTNVFNRYLDF